METLEDHLIPKGWNRIWAAILVLLGKRMVLRRSVDLRRQWIKGLKRKKL